MLNDEIVCDKIVYIFLKYLGRDTHAVWRLCLRLGGGLWLPVAYSVAVHFAHPCLAISSCCGCLLC